MLRAFAVAIATFVLIAFALLEGGCGGASSPNPPSTGGASSGGSTSNSNPNQSNPAAVNGVWIHDAPTVAAHDPFGSQQTPVGALANLQSMKSFGITAIAADCFTNPAFLSDDFAAAQSLGLSIAADIDLSVLFQHGATQFEMWHAESTAISQYCTEFGNNRAAARTPDGRLIVWIYGTHQMTAASWESAIAAVRLNSPDVFLVGDTSGPSPGFDGEWDFWPGSTTTVTTLMPQYTHPGNDSGLSPDGGHRYSEQWQAAIASKAPGVDINSWNSYADGSEIDDNQQLQSETAEYSSKYRSAMAAS